MLYKLIYECRYVIRMCMNNKASYWGPDKHPVPNNKTNIKCIYVYMINIII